MIVVRVTLISILASLLTGCCFFTAPFTPASWPVSYQVSTKISSDWRTPIKKAGKSWGVMNYSGIGSQNFGIDGVRTVGIDPDLPDEVLAQAGP